MTPADRTQTRRVAKLCADRPRNSFICRASYTAHHKNLVAYVGDPPRRNVAVNGVGILRRAFGALLNAMEKSRQKQTEREITNFVASRGGRLTDDLEREMMRRLLTSDWSPRER